LSGRGADAFDVSWPVMALHNIRKMKIRNILAPAENLSEDFMILHFMYYLIKIQEILQEKKNIRA
jgi:hypothetical protein